MKLHFTKCLYSNNQINTGYWTINIHKSNKHIKEMCRISRVHTKNGINLKMPCDERISVFSRPKCGLLLLISLSKLWHWCSSERWGSFNYTYHSQGLYPERYISLEITLGEMIELVRLRCCAYYSAGPEVESCWLCTATRKYRDINTYHINLQTMFM